MTETVIESPSVRDLSEGMFTVHNGDGGALEMAFTVTEPMEGRL